MCFDLPANHDSRLQHWFAAGLQAFGIDTKEALLGELRHQLQATPAEAGLTGAAAAGTE